MRLTSVGKRVLGTAAALALTTSLFGGAVAAQDDTVVFLSTQLQPEAEQAKMNDVILADYPGSVKYVPVANTGEFISNVKVDAAVPERAGNDLLGGLHGEFAAMAKDGLLMDLSGLVAELDISPALLEAGMLGTDEQLYIPWMQATYIMAAHKSALEYLPEGADLNALTWDQVKEWGANLLEASGERLLGLPTGDQALHHRLFQGYLYPSFTGGVNTTFATPEAVEMWNWLADLWQYVNPESSTRFNFMQDHLIEGSVTVAWDHTARLIEALRSSPDDFVAFPAPAGPEGRGFMPVIVGLAIPKTAPNPEGAMDLIRYLVTPDTQGITLREVAFFPVAAGEVAADVDAAVQMQLDAVSAQANSEDALLAQLPVGLGDQGGAYSNVFKDAFKAIIIDGGDPVTVLPAFAPALQETLDLSGAECWAPDPPSDGVCQVGNTLGG